MVDKAVLRQSPYLRLSQTATGHFLPVGKNDYYVHKYETLLTHTLPEVEWGTVLQTFHTLAQAIVTTCTFCHNLANVKTQMINSRSMTFRIACKGTVAT